MAALEQRSRAGDATNDLYSQYGKQIYSYCLHKLRSKEEAEDAVQTTFMNAFRSLQRGTTTQFEQAWLFKIAHNVCVARATSSSRRLRLEAPNDFEVLQEVVPSKEGDGDSLELMGIEEALELMPENQRRAILLREWQGLSYREISDELGLSQAAVEMLIFRARRALAGALEQPEEARAKHGRVARRVGSMVAGVVGALKTLLGGGAAIKAVTIAAAAIAVVGESADHTIVRPQRHVTKPRAAAPIAKAPAVSAPAQTPALDRVAHAVAASRTHVDTAPARVTHPPVVTHHQRVPVRTDEVAVPAAAAPAPAPAPASHHVDPTPAPAAAASKPDSAPTAPAPAPVVPLVQPAPAPAPAPAPPPAAEKPAKTEKPDKAEKTFVAPNTPVQQPPAPPEAPVAVAPAEPPAAPPAADNGNGNGNAFGKDKDHGKPADATTTPPPPTTTPTPAPAAEPHGNGNGNGNGKKP